jgi:hypothetical protein
MLNGGTVLSNAGHLEMLSDKKNMVRLIVLGSSKLEARAVAELYMRMPNEILRQYIDSLCELLDTNDGEELRPMCRQLRHVMTLDHDESSSLIMYCLGKFCEVGKKNCNYYAATNLLID